MMFERNLESKNNKFNFFDFNKNYRELSESRLDSNGSLDQRNYLSLVFYNCLYIFYLVLLKNKLLIESMDYVQITSNYKQKISLMAASAFESLIVDICEKIMGKGVCASSDGKDRGIDAYFKGVAPQFSLTSSKYIIQAKHTKKPNCERSINQFYKGNKSLIDQEIPKLNKLISSKELDFYFIFTNRDLGNSGKSKTVKKLVEGTNLSENNVFVYDIVYIEQQLRAHSDIVRRNNLNKSLNGITLSDEIADLFRILLERLSEHLKNYETLIGEKSESDNSPIDELKLINLTEKNEANNISPQYAYIIEDSIPNISKIKILLTEYMNEKDIKLYNNVVTSIRAKFASIEESSIAVKFDLFCEDLLKTHPMFIEHNHDVHLLLYEMYASCNIGNRPEKKSA